MWNLIIRKFEIKYVISTLLFCFSSSFYKFEKTACGTKEEFSKTDTTKHVQAYSSEFQVFINNIRVIVPGDFSPAALAGLMKVLKTL